MTTSNIVFAETPASSATQIVQLFEHLELFSEGEPPRHTLFVLGRAPLRAVDLNQTIEDQLLLIDPPPDVQQRFKVEGNVAVLFTRAPVETGLPHLQTVTGGVAHLRIGEHFWDIY